MCGDRARAPPRRARLVKALILDSGAFIAVERGDRAMLARLSAAHLHGVDLRTNAAVVGQVWRDGRRQVSMARMLRAVDVRDIDQDDGRAAGELLERAGTSDVIDATCVLLAAAGDSIVTSDPTDIRRLTVAAGLDARVVPC